MRNWLDVDETTEMVLPARGIFPTEAHVFDPKTVLAVNAALSARRPLLVAGETGVGKSQLARAVAEKLERAFVHTVIDAASEARDLVWTFDAVARLAEAQIVGKEEDREARLAVRKFVRPGPLWWALNRGEARDQCKHCPTPEPPFPNGWKPENGSVLLIDEIDKGEADVPNGLLEVLGRGEFTPPGYSKSVEVEGAAPLVVITTNAERTLPDAFVRRCLVLRMEIPEDGLVSWLTRRGEAHFGEHCPEPVRVKAAEQLTEDRAKASKDRLPPPGLAEYLDLLRALCEPDPEDRRPTQKEQLDLLGRIKDLFYTKHQTHRPRV